VFGRCAGGIGFSVRSSALVVPATLRQASKDEAIAFAAVSPVALQSVAFVGVIGVAKSTAGLGPKGKAKVAAVFKEWGKGDLRSGSKSGPVVKSQRQATAIALNQARKVSRARGS
jgi:hypothetical protein